MSILWMVGAFFLILTPIILVHELGHFFVARRWGIKIEEFGLGFPPRAAKLFEQGGTLFTLNWIPLGGFVRPAGEDDPDVPGGLSAAPKRARFEVLVAGAAANFLFAIAVFWLAFVIGQPIVDESKAAIGAVLEDSPAMQAGLEPGDVIVEVNGKPVAAGIVDGQEVSPVEMLIAEIHANAGRPVEMVIDRQGELLTVTVTPRLPGEFAANEGPTGISLTHPLTGETDAMGPIEAVGASVGAVWNVLHVTVSVPAMLIRGDIDPSMARPVSVVGISQIAGYAAESTATTGHWFPLLSFTALISVALGLTNLLPLPALDGGRILFVLLEAVRGRRVEPEREGMVHLIGMLLLLGLMVLIIIQDIINPIIPF